MILIKCYRNFFVFVFLNLYGVISVLGQQTMLKPNMLSLQESYALSKNKPTTNKSTNCMDTIRYPQSKLTGFVEVDTMDIATYIGAVSQAFHFTGAGEIHGISAYMLLDLDGVPGNTAPITMTIKVYNINNNNYPTTVIDSAVVQVADVGFQEQPLMFNSPVAVTDSFAVAVEINPAFPVNPYYVTNTGANNDGNGEKLSCVTWTGTWFNSFIDFLGWDVDMMIAPIFTHDIVSSFTIDTDSVCPGEGIVFSNTSMNNMNSMFNDISQPIYSWDFDDGTGLYNSIDTTYNFPNPGQYDVILTCLYNGHTNNCNDISTKTITILDTAFSNFGFVDMGGGTYQFSDSTLFAESYSWDFGDGSALDTTMNPLHSYATMFAHMVCLTVSNKDSCNVHTSCRSVGGAVGEHELKNEDRLTIFPIPANNYLNLVISPKYYYGKVIITNVVGENVRMLDIEEDKLIKISTQGMLSGIYFVSIKNDEGSTFTKRVLVNR